MANNAGKREEAREKARQLREQQAKREKRNRALLIGGVGILVVAVIAMVITIVNWGNQPAIAKLDDAQIPANTQVEDGGIPVGSTSAAGSTNDGAPVVDVYLDYTCHYCLIFEETYKDFLNQAAADGQATVVYHPVGILDASGDFSGYSGRAAAAAAAVADGDPQNFLAGHEALVAMGQEVVDSQGQVQPDSAQITQSLEAAGVSSEAAQAAGGDNYREWVQATTTQFGQDGYSGTPTILVDGEKIENWSEPNALQEAVDAAQG